MTPETDTIHGMNTPQTPIEPGLLNEIRRSDAYDVADIPPAVYRIHIRALLTEHDRQTTEHATLTAAYATSQATTRIAQARVNGLLNELHEVRTELAVVTIHRDNVVDDEVQRLRRKVAKLRRRWRKSAAAALREALQVEELRAAFDQLLGERNAARAERGRLGREVEELRVELQAARVVTDGVRDGARIEIDRLLDERDRVGENGGSDDDKRWWARLLRGQAVPDQYLYGVMLAADFVDPDVSPQAYADRWFPADGETGSRHVLAAARSWPGLKSADGPLDVARPGRDALVAAAVPAGELSAGPDAGVGTPDGPAGLSGVAGMFAAALGDDHEVLESWHRSPECWAEPGSDSHDGCDGTVVDRGDGVDRCQCPHHDTGEAGRG